MVLWGCSQGSNYCGKCTTQGILKATENDRNTQCERKGLNEIIIVFIEVIDKELEIFTETNSLSATSPVVYDIDACAYANRDPSSRKVP